MGNRTGRGTAQGRRWGTWRVSAAVGLVVLLAVTGCSGDGDDQGGGTTPGPIGPGGLPPEHATTTEGLEVTGPVTTGRGRPQTATPIYVASRGYVEEEYFLSGDAQSYEPDGEWGEEGRWAVTPAATAPFTTHSCTATSTRFSAGSSGRARTSTRARSRTFPFKRTAPR